jgi:hypothetical protein
VKDGKAHGRGKMVKPVTITEGNGRMKKEKEREETYSGQWKEGKRCGKGILTYGNM